MNNCIILLPKSKEESDLYLTLLDKVNKGNQIEAQRQYKFFKSEGFMEEFGDWIAEADTTDKTINPEHLNDKGEPNLFYDNTRRSYFFKNRDGHKKYYPNNENKLRSKFSSEYIYDIRNRLGTEYLKLRLDEGFGAMDMSESDVTLGNFIEQEIQDRAKKMMSSRNRSEKRMANTLIESLEHMDEWIFQVENLFSEMRITYKEQTESDLKIISEESFKDGTSFGVASFERSTKDNVSSDIKMRLSMIEAIDPNSIEFDALRKKGFRTGVNGDGPIDPRIDPVFKEPKIIPFDEVYGTIMSNIVGERALVGEDIFQIQFNKIKELATKKPYLSSLVDQLEGADQYVKSKFVQAFTLSKNNFIATIINMKPNEDGTPNVSFEFRNVSTMADKRNHVRSQWHYNLVDNMMTDGAFDLKKAYSSLGEWKKRASDINKDQVKNKYEGTRESVMNLLDDMGMKVDNATMDYYLDGLKFNELDSDARNSNLMKLRGSIEYFLNNIDVKDISEFESILSDQVEFGRLAESAGFFSADATDSSIFSAGKSKWIYSYQTYLANTVSEWKKSPDLLAQRMKLSPFYKDTIYGQFLTAHNEIDPILQAEAREKNMEKFDIVDMNSIQLDGRSSEGDSPATASKTDLYADSYNKLLRTMTPSGDVFYVMTPAPADKSRQFMMQVPRDLFRNSNVRIIDGDIKVSDSAVKPVYQYVVSEFRRIKDVLDKIDQDPESNDLRVSYHLDGRGELAEAGQSKGAKFSLLDSLNVENLNQDELGFDLYYREDGQNGQVKGQINRNLEFLNSENISDLNSPEAEGITQALFEYVRRAMNQKVVETKDHLNEAGILDTSEFKNKAIDSDIWRGYQSKYPGANSETIINNIAGDIVLNGIISQVEYSKLFSGDYSYYKSPVDYIKRIQSTYTDGQQLALRGEGNGVDMDLETFFNVSVISNVEVASPYYSQLKQMVGERVAKHYSEGIDATDAQGWITPKRWKFLKERLGQWDVEHNNLWAKMDKQDLNPYTEAELKMLATPLKGVHFEIDHTGTPIYLKYSSAVLTKDLIKGSPQLETLFNKMEETNTHELITHSGIKVGANKPSVTHNADYSVRDISEIEFNPIQLKNSSWKLQQDSRINNFFQTYIGSQLQTNIFESPANNLLSEFNVDGKNMSGSQLITRLNDLMGQKVSAGRDSLHSKLGLSEDGRINNKDAMYGGLIRELKSRGAPNNVILALENGISAYGIPGFSEKIQNSFSSIVTESVVRTKTNGGQFVQMSNYGLSKTEAVDAGVKWAPWAENTTSEPKMRTNEAGLIAYRTKGGRIEYGTEAEIKSAGSKPIINPGGVLISGSLIAEYIPGYAKMSPEQLFGTKENGYKGLIDKRILDSVIGYRIPNQALASNDALQVFGILPETQGDTVVAYTGITKKTGSDFDIDTMYIMIPDIVPQRKQASKLRTYARQYLRGDTVADTMGNINEVLDMMPNQDIYDNLDPEEFALLLNDSSGKGMQSLAYIVDQFVEAVLKEDVPVSQYIKESIEGYNEVEYLKYDDRSVSNQIIEVYKAALTNYDVMPEVMTPIDFEFFKNDLVSFRGEKYSSDLSFFTLKDQIDIRHDYLGGGAGIGQLANSLKDHIRGRMANEYIHKPYGIKGVFKMDPEMSSELSSFDMKYYNQNVEGDHSELKSIKVANTMSAILNGFLDIANDPFITEANWNTVTTDVGLTLVRMGVHPFKVNAFISNTTIRRYVEFVNTNESKIVDNSGQMMSKFREVLINEELDRKGYISVTSKDGSVIDVPYGEVNDLVRNDNSAYNASKSLNGVINKSDFDAFLEAKKDINALITKTQSIDIDSLPLKSLREGKLDRYKALKTFENLVKSTKNVTRNVRASKSDGSGYGKNSTELLMMMNDIYAAINSENITGFESKLIQNGNPTMLYHYIQGAVFNTKNIMEQNALEFPMSNPSVMNTFNYISSAVYGDPLTNGELGDKLTKSYYTYMMSKFDILNVSDEVRADILERIPSEVNDLKNKVEPGQYYIIDELVPTPSENGFFLGMSNRKRSNGDHSRLIESWLDLKRDEPKLANELVQYSYITTGFQNSINQFFSYIPHEFFAEGNINSHISQMGIDNANRLGEVDYDFIDRFFRHNLQDKSLVGTVFTEYVEFIKGATGYEAISIKPKGEHHDFNVSPPKMFVSREIEVEARGIEPDSSFDAYYKLQGINHKGNPVYLRTSELGLSDNKGNNIYEYNNKESYDTSRVYPISDKGRSAVAESVLWTFDYESRIPDYNEISSAMDIIRKTDSYTQNDHIQLEEGRNVLVVNSEGNTSEGVIEGIRNDHGVVMYEVRSDNVLMYLSVDDVFMSQEFIDNNMPVRYSETMRYMNSEGESMADIKSDIDSSISERGINKDDSKDIFKGPCPL